MADLDYLITEQLSEANHISAEIGTLECLPFNGVMLFINSLASSRLNNSKTSAEVSEKKGGHT